VACSDPRHSGAGLRLPDGDAARGRAAFVEMRCHACHAVDGVETAAPVAEPVVPVVLGGAVPRPVSDGTLVTAIVNPSHEISHGYLKSAVAIGRRSRMGEYGEAMTVQQLVDIVAFLQSRYRVVAPAYRIK